MRLLRLVLALLLFAGCGTKAAPFVPEADELLAMADELEESALLFERDGGDWLEDYGDAPFFGTAFYARSGSSQSAAPYTEIADSSRAFARAVVDQGNGDVGFLVDNFDEAIMSALGLIEYSDASAEQDDLAAVDELIDTANDFAGAFGDYIDVDIGSYALDTYGPTAVTAGVALLNLQYAIYVDSARAGERVARAGEIVEAIASSAFDGAKYQFRPGEEKLYLYPNMIMMIVLARLYECTGDEDYLSRAEELYEAIQPLKRARGNYYSPYSAEYMGATTDDYSTLSSQNYLTLALLLVYENTKDDRYLAEALEILSFVREYLYDPDQGRLLHHWIDGHIAEPTDHEYFCSGCNLQFLYIVWYLETRILSGYP